MCAGEGRSLLPSVGSGGVSPCGVTSAAGPFLLLCMTVSPGLPGAEANRSLHPGSYPRALLKSSIVLVIPHAYGVDLSESRGIHQQQ